MDYKDPDNYIWYILPGRQVSHAIIKNQSVGWGICGVTGHHRLINLIEAFKYTKRCEQCLITIVTGLHKLVPVQERIHSEKLRKQYWRDYLNQHPEIAPKTWKG